MTADNWRPDWRDPEQYPDPHTTSMLQWAWEFLRRNPEYQTDYAEWIKPPTSFTSDPEELERLGDKWAVGSREEQLWAHYRSKYPLKWPVDPATNFGKEVENSLLRIGGPQYGWYHPKNKASVALEASRPGDVVMRFNVGEPISGQIERAKNVLKKFRSLNEDAGFV